jgi:hypothetical protein
MESSKHELQRVVEHMGADATDRDSQTSRLVAGTIRRRGLGAQLGWPGMMTDVVAP